MEKQEQVIRAFCNQIADHRTGSLTELAPRSGEKYRFASMLEGAQGAICNSYLKDNWVL